MRNVEIILYYPKSRMYCASCSLTITNTIKNFLARDHSDLEYKNFAHNTVTAEYQKRTVGITINAKNIEFLNKFLLSLLSELSDVGYECYGYIIRTIDGLLDAFKSKEEIDEDEFHDELRTALLAKASMHEASETKDNSLIIAMKDELPLIEKEEKSKTRHTAKKELLSSILPLGSGAGLMLSEHMSWLPKSSTTPGLITNVGIGIASTVITGWAGKDNFKGAWSTRRNPANGAMNTLIAIGAIAAILYSFLLIAIPDFFAGADSASYFSVPLVILGFLKLSHGIRDYIQTNIDTQVDQIDVLKQTLPEIAYIYRSEEKTSIPDQIKQEKFVFDNKKMQLVKVSEVKKDSIIVVEKNGTVPIDSILLAPKNSQVRESIFGRKEEVIKIAGKELFASTINKGPELLLLKTLCEAQDNHLRRACSSVKIAPEENLNLQRIRKSFLYAVFAAAVFGGVGWGYFDSLPQGIQVFLSVMFSACPCAFGLVDIGLSVTKFLAFAEGILIQQDIVLEIDKMVHFYFDKCGTLTPNNLEFKEVCLLTEPSDHLQLKKQFFNYALVLEEKIPTEERSAVAAAIIQAGKLPNWQLPEVVSCTDFKSNPINKGRGGIATINGDKVVIGNKGLMLQQGIMVENSWSELEAKKIKDNADNLPIFMAINKQIVCLLVLRSISEMQQTLRPGVKEIIHWLIRHKKKVHILTGDNKDRLTALNTLLQTQDITLKSSMTPQDKVDYIKQHGGGVMVGDEINDLGALKAATIGIAIDTLAPIRGEADVVLNGELSGIVKLIRLAETHRAEYRTSITIAFGVNSVNVLSAIGAFYPLTKKLVDPMITGGSMAFSSLALMLAIFLFKFRKSRRIKQPFQTLFEGEEAKEPLLQHSKSSLTYSILSGELGKSPSNISGRVLNQPI